MSRPMVHQTGRVKCYDAVGNILPCRDSGQDGEHRFGRKWNKTRFRVNNNTVHDGLTGLTWQRHADMTGERLSWQQALDIAIAYNSTNQNRANWRLPNINELESLVDCSTSHPALPQNHAFVDAKDSYWSSTTSYFEPDWAWALYLDKGAIGAGKKGRHFHVWLVSGP